MKATITKISKKDCTTSDGKKFSVIDIKCNVTIDDKGNIHEAVSSMSIDYATKYFNYCGISSKEAIGKTVEVVLGKKEFTAKDGTNKIYTFIRFLNFIDNEGNPIIMRKDDNSELPF